MSTSGTANTWMMLREKKSPKTVKTIPAARETAIAKAWVGRACRRVMNSAHQIHGAIGFSQDHILHYYTKKAASNEYSFGDSDYQLEKLVS